MKKKNMVHHGPVGAIGLVAHSFLDGAAIGIAFQANAKSALSSPWR